MVELHRHTCTFNKLQTVCKRAHDPLLTQVKRRSLRAAAWLLASVTSLTATLCLTVYGGEAPPFLLPCCY